jgi:hypothetical protein
MVRPADSACLCVRPLLLGAPSKEGREPAATKGGLSESSAASGRRACGVLLDVRRDVHQLSTRTNRAILPRMPDGAQSSTAGGRRGRAMSRALAAVDWIRRLLRPPLIVAVARRPAGWHAVARRLHDVVAWAQLDDDQVVGLVVDRRGLRPATGRRFHGYLPAAASSMRDVQLALPEVVFPVADLVEAIADDLANPWTSEAQVAIYSRLRIAAEQEWAGRALISFVADPDEFLKRHFRLVIEHSHRAELDAAWRAAFASITKPPAHAGSQSPNTGGDT